MERETALDLGEEEEEQVDADAKRASAESRRRT
jgi:hypothetical protein